MDSENEQAPGVEEVEAGFGPEAPEAAPVAADTPAKPKKRKKKKPKPSSLGTSRGIETMFRTSYRVHMDLSSLADTKANIMISINGLIISITLASVAPRIALNPALLWPTSILVIGCLLALVYAVLAARPRVSSKPLTLEDLRENRANILFFGNFVNMSEDDFVEGMKDLMLDTNHLYTNMVRDLYGLGQVLKRKFEMLRVSYNIFMVALVVGVALFIWAFATAPGAASGLLEPLGGTGP